MRRIAEATAASYRVACEVGYSREFIPTLKDAETTAHTLATAAMAEHNTGSEDFAQFLAHAPGCFAFIGNGEASAPLHHPLFDFNDAVLPHGVGFFMQIVSDRLAPGGAA